MNNTKEITNVTINNDIIPNDVIKDLVKMTNDYLGKHDMECLADSPRIEKGYLITEDNIRHNGYIIYRRKLLFSCRYFMEIERIPINDDRFKIVYHTPIELPSIELCSCNKYGNVYMKSYSWYKYNGDYLPLKIEEVDEQGVDYEGFDNIWIRLGIDK